MTQSTNARPTQVRTDERWKALPKARRHALLDTIATEMRGCHRTQDVSAYGRVYTLRTIDPTEEDWGDQFVSGANFFQTARGVRGPRIAAALTAVDGVSVDELFQPPDEMSADDRRLLIDNPPVLWAWRAQEVLRWLTGPDMNSGLIEKLYSAHLDLQRSRNEALEALDPLSKGQPTATAANPKEPTPEPDAPPSTGTSSATSSPERPSLPATLRSLG